MSDCSEIVLVRHGESALPFPGWLTLPQFRDWIAEYNRVGISADSHPEPSLVELVATAPHILCSDYRRALESVERLAATVVPQVTPVLREAGRPPLWNCPLRLPLRTWDAISRAMWRIGMAPTDESFPAARERAAEAAALLVESAREHGRVVAVGHGTLHRMTAEGLLQEGWLGPSRLRLKHWGCAIYRKDESLKR